MEENSGLNIGWPVNAEMENQPYLRNGKTYYLETWCTDDPHHRHAGRCTVISEVKGQRYKVTSV